MPFQDVDAAVKEVDRAITKLGLVGITVGTFGMKEHVGQPAYWPIYEELQKLNAPLLIHNSRQGPAGEIRFDTFLFRHTIGRPFETLLDCAALCTAECRKSFPKLRIAFLNAVVVGFPTGWTAWTKNGKNGSRKRRCSKRNRANT